MTLNTFVRGLLGASLIALVGGSFLALPASAQSVIVQTRTKTIEEVFQECAARIRTIVTDTETRVNRNRDISIRRLERLDAKNVPNSIIELTGERLRRPFPALTRTGVIRLNREIANSMIQLRKHKDYAPEYQTYLNEEVDEAQFDFQMMVDDAREAIDAAVTRLTTN